MAARILSLAYGRPASSPSPLRSITRPKQLHAAVIGLGSTPSRPPGRASGSAKEGVDILILDPMRHEPWHGQSGSTYVHAVFGLVPCPDVPRCVAVLVRNDGSGTKEPLAVLRLEDRAPCANLAQIRHIGATLGANEVHVCVDACTPTARRAIVRDLEAAFGWSRA